MRRFSYCFTCLIAVALGLLVNVLLVSAAVDINSQMPVRYVDTQENHIAITFNSSWGVEFVPEILRILDENGVKSTFFVCGVWVDKNPDTLKLIYEAGHEIANHGYSHAHSATISLEQNKREISKVHDKVESLLGISMNLFRPPYGEYNNDVLQAARQLDYYTITWDVDSIDWMAMGAEKQINDVLNNKNLKNGSIIMFHTDQNSIYTPVVLDTIIKGLRAKGYELLTVSELLGLKEIAIFTPAPDVIIIYDGLEIYFSQPPVAKNGYIFFLLEDILEIFSGGHGWDGDRFVVFGEKNGNLVEIPLHDLSYWVNGSMLDVPPELMPFVENERTYVYLDYIVEGLGLSVEWDGETRTISIK